MIGFNPLHVSLTLSRNSFYPLYPPAEGIPLDFSLAPEALEISSIPDILILPSDLTHFVKVRVDPLLMS